MLAHWGLPGMKASSWSNTWSLLRFALGYYPDGGVLALFTLAASRAAFAAKLTKRHASAWSPAFQPIIVAAAFVLTETVSGMIEASATRSPAMP
jgi:hypothetical protein